MIADDFPARVRRVVSTLALLAIVVPDVVSILLVKFVRDVLPRLVVGELSLPVHQCVFESDADAFEEKTVLHAGAMTEVVRTVQFGVKKLHAHRERLLGQRADLI